MCEKPHLIENNIQDIIPRLKRTLASSYYYTVLQEYEGATSRSQKFTITRYYNVILALKNDPLLKSS